MAVSPRVVGFAAVVILLFPLGGAASDASTASFADATGDAPAGPDFTAVDVSSDGGRVTFTVHSADAARWEGWRVDILVDSDANYATGHGDGVDHLFSLTAAHTFSATRWDGQSFTRYGSAATGGLAGDAFRVSVPLGELDNTTKLAFAVVASASDTVGDQAPDGSFAPGMPPRWQFSPDVPRVTALMAAFAPAQPRHGARFAARAVMAKLSTGDTRPARSPACVARLTGARLSGRCSWHIPAPARGKRLVVTVSGEGLTRSYRFVVG